MIKLSVLTLFAGLAFSQHAAAINVTCNVGATNGMLKTAYVTVRTEALEYRMGGYMYGMMVSVDRANNVRGEWAAGGYKTINNFAWMRFWISRTPIHADERRVLGAGGLIGSTEKQCQSVYTQILW